MITENYNFAPVGLMLYRVQCHVYIRVSAIVVENIKAVFNITRSDAMDRSLIFFLDFVPLDMSNSMVRSRAN